ncbi:MAG: phosphotransferase family protein [Myxococcales bacterium]|nr:phosphotransferase family protein [Myxococcales bacterium]
MEELAARIARYVGRCIPDADEVEVKELERIHGGASRETYRLRVTFRQAGSSQQRRLILRRDPAGSLIETDRATEYRAYQAFYGTSVPVPEPLWLEESGEWLERPFFVMEEIQNCEASPAALLLPPYAEHLERIGEQKWRILGEIAAADPVALGLCTTSQLPAAESCWERELGHWEQVIDEDELCPQPIARGAIRWLRRNPPAAAAKLCVVHGDYRTGNFLVAADAEIRGILDWEMTHLGDPLEDLAWSINRIWCWARDDRVGGLLSRERAIAIWEEASGLRAEPAALRWWELFASVKASAIWISSGREISDAKSKDPVLAFTAWWLPNAQDRVTLETLGRFS